MARAQGRLRRVVLVGGLNRDLEQRLGELGFVPGRDVAIERPAWDASATDVRRVMAEAARSRADVIVACGALPTQAAVDATKTIPIVMAYGPDPVIMGFARSFARPGGNLTGLSWSASESVIAKAAEVFKEAIPTAKAFAVLGYAEDPGHRWLAREAQEKWPALGVRYVDMLLGAREELDASFERILGQGAAGIIVIPNHFVRTFARRTLEHANRHRIPILWGVGFRPSHELLTFGPVVGDHERRAADYVGRILSGARPGDLPIEQTTRIALGVSLLTAERLGIRIPASLVARADEVVR